MKLSVLLAAAAAQAALAADAGAFVNTKVSQWIDLQRYVVRVSSSIRAEGTGGAGKYTLAFPSAYGPAAHLEVKDEDGTSFGVSVSVDQDREDTTQYTVNLGKGIKAGEEVVLKSTAYFTHLLEPYPAVVEQSEDQLVRFTGDLLLRTPYTTTSQTTTVKLGTTEIEEYSEGPGDKVKEDGENLKYGPYKDSEGWAQAEFMVHFKNHFPFAQMVEVEREVEVSHWGNVAVEEHYHLRHGGAMLQDGLFSRVDYQGKRQVGASFSSLTATLPALAQDVYYRDIIGNISTSHFRRTLSESTLEIQPRFPLFGGWRTEWYQGYNLPTESVLRVEGDRYTLTFPANIPYPDTVVDSFVQKVVLPEGASDIEIDSPLPLTDSSSTTRFTYLDFMVGRPVLLLRHANVVKQQKGDITVTYTVPPGYWLREPAALTTVLFLLFVLGMFIARLDCSIARKSKTE